MTTMQMPEPTIDFTPRMEHPSSKDRPRNTSGDDQVPSVMGYNAVYKIGKFWFAYSGTPDGGSRRAGHGTREAAIADIRQDCAGSWAFWLEKVQWRENGDVTPRGTRVIRVDGVHRTAGAIRRGVDPSCLGSAGRWCRFRLLESGEVVESNDVWWQGLIPAEFADLLPDNAEDVREERQLPKFGSFAIGDM